MTDVQLIYASTASGDLSIDEVKDVVKLAAQKNMGIGISGFLCANSRYFLQCLEGDKESIDSLYQTISRDMRHHNLNAIGCEPIASRTFESWGMGVVLGLDRHKEILKKYNADSVFNPYSLTFKQCLAMLSEFAGLKKI
ncbi:MAG: BLUF domain-containing protein [Agarilytica sp.]